MRDIDVLWGYLVEVTDKVIMNEYVERLQRDHLKRESNASRNKNILVSVASGIGLSLIGFAGMAFLKLKDK